MQARPVRSQIYLPVLRFGITDEDWGIVIAAGILGYAIPFLFGMKYVLQAKSLGPASRRRLPGGSTAQWPQTNREEM